MTKMIKLASLLLVVVLCVGMLAACGGIDSYQKKLEKAGYEVEVAEEADIDKMNAMYEELGVDYKIKGMLSAMNVEEMATVSIVQFASAGDAKKALAEEENLDEDDYIRKGAVVIMGNEKGLELFK